MVGLSSSDGDVLGTASSTTLSPTTNEVSSSGGSSSSSSRKRRIKNVIDTIQSVQVPVSWVRRWKQRKRSTSTTGSSQQQQQPILPFRRTQAQSLSTPTNDDIYNNDDDNNDNDTDVLYCISGLEKVFITEPGDSCADAPVLIVGIRLPRYIWYMISGFIGDIFQFIVSAILYYILLLHDPSTCWCIGFTISIIVRHTCHRYFVFGNYIGGYRASLQRMYTAYSIIIILSTFFNKIVSHIAPSINFIVLFILTLLWTGIANYFILKKCWSIGAGTNNTNTTSNTATG